MGLKATTFKNEFKKKTIIKKKQSFKNTIE